MIKVGIIGGAGYTAGELLSLLLNHPEVSIEFVHSSSHAGAPVATVHGGLIGETNLVFSKTHPLNDIDLLFMCSGHGKSSEFWERRKRPENLMVIDLSQDYRDESGGFIYGLPEVNYEKIAGAKLIANPGCFATAIELSLLPLAKAGKLPNGNDVNITAITGSTGAGVKPSQTTHFSWRSNNVSVYKPFTHQHLKEIRMILDRMQPDNLCRINFIPVRGDFPRGIFAMVTMRCTMPIDELKTLYKNFYSDSAFTHVCDRPIDLKQVVNTNKALIYLEKHSNMLLITVAIDNLLKGASGQAVQNMNIMLGIDQTAGLRLKPSSF